MKSAILIFLCLFLCCISAKKKSFFHRQSPNLKYSRPYSEVLERVKTLMGADYLAKVPEELEKLNKMEENQLLEYFNIPNYGGDVKKYWFTYYLFAQMVFFSNTHYTAGSLGKIEDHYYK